MISPFSIGLTPLGDSERVLDAVGYQICPSADVHGRRELHLFLVDEVFPYSIAASFMIQIQSSF